MERNSGEHAASFMEFDDGEREITGGGIVVLLVATLIAIPIWAMILWPMWR